MENVDTRLINVQRNVKKHIVSGVFNTEKKIRNKTQGDPTEQFKIMRTGITGKTVMTENDTKHNL